jgi:hypothetical protein
LLHLICPLLCPRQFRTASSSSKSSSLDNFQFFQANSGEESESACKLGSSFQEARERICPRYGGDHGLQLRFREVGWQKHRQRGHRCCRVCSRLGNCQRRSQYCGHCQHCHYCEQSGLFGLSDLSRYWLFVLDLSKLFALDQSRLFALDLSNLFSPDQSDLFAPDESDSPWVSTTRCGP